MWGEVEKNSLIVLPGKGGHSGGLIPSKLFVPTGRGGNEEFDGPGLKSRV